MQVVSPSTNIQKQSSGDFSTSKDPLGSIEGSAHFYKESTLGFVGPIVSVAVTQHVSAKADIANMKTNDHDGVPYKLYKGILEFEFHIVFTKYYLDFFSPNHLNM